MLLNSVVQSAVLPSSSGAGAGSKAFHGAEQRIEVPLNAAWLRVGVEDVMAGRLGTMEIALPLAVDPPRVAGP